MPSLTSRSGMLFAVALFAAAFFCVSEADIAVKWAGNGEEKTIASRSAEGAISVSIKGVCDVLGFTCRWNKTNQKLTCVKEGQKLVFSEDIPFYYSNDTLRQFPCVPVREGSVLYLPAWMAVKVLNDLGKERIEWNDVDSTIVINAVKPIMADAQEKPALDREKMPESSSIDVKNAPVIERQLIKTIVIDPGHGGKDPGAIGPDGAKEKDIVLSIGLKLRDMLKKKRLSIYLTRDDDTFIPLQDRTKFANGKKADIFLSIHANSIEGANKKKETKGYKVYFLSQAKNEEDKMAAMRENAVIQLEDQSRRYDNLQDILTKMEGNEFLRESQDMSIIIDEAFDGALKKVEKLHLGIGQANFWVLNGAYMPSVLVEIGFLSNPDEGKILVQDSFQKTIAAVLNDAIMQFTAKIEAGQ
jgi:N-acetylmuramoyl-L-alanine amidase